jgi:hypothetical protein
MLSRQEKIDLVRQWERSRYDCAKRGRPMSSAAVPKGISLSRLYTWRRQLLAGDLAKLQDGRSRRLPSLYANDPFMRLVLRLRCRGLSCAACCRQAMWHANAAGWKRHSYRAVLRWLHRAGVGSSRFGRPAKAVRSAI